MDLDDPPYGEKTYLWQIENFSMCPQTKEECLKSTPFYVDSKDGSEYQLILYPRGKGHGMGETAVCLLECLKESDFCISVTMSIDFNSKQTEVTWDGVLKTGETIECWEFLSRKLDVHQKHVLFRDDLLTIRCTVIPMYKELLVSKEDMQKLSEDLGEMFTKGLFSDFCLIVMGGRRFSVHKMMLVIRCRKLAKVVGIVDNEASCEEARMEQVSPEAMELFLQYIYTGKLRENLPSELLNAVYDMAEEFEMDDLKRDLFPQEICTVGRTIVRVDNHHFTWDVGDVLERAENREWPVQTFLDLVIGRFVASLTLEAAGVIARIDLRCQCLNLDGSLTMRCVVTTSGQTIYAGEHRFESGKLDEVFVMRGDGSLLFQERAVLTFEFSVSHLRCTDECHKEEGILCTPSDLWKKSLIKLSADMDVAFKGCLEGVKDYHTDMIVTRDAYGSPMPAHKCVLAARSSYILKAVTDSQTSKFHMGGDHVGAESAEFLLRYIYSGMLSGDCRMGRILELYRCASRYDVRISERCLHLFRTKSGLKDLVMIVYEAHDFPDLLLVAAYIIRRMRDEVLNSTEWAKLLKEVPSRAKSALRLADTEKDLMKWC